MIVNLTPSVFTIEIGDMPALVFEAQNFRKARGLCHEQWLTDDVAEAKVDRLPLRDGKAKLRARRVFRRGIRALTQLWCSSDYSAPISLA